MKCLICKKTMKIREGKYGPFYYCPNGNHGTISVKKYNTIIQKAINNPINKSDPLMIAIEQQTITLGGGIMTDLERFYIDNEAFYDNQDDFWQNQREY